MKRFKSLLVFIALVFGPVAMRGQDRAAAAPAPQHAAHKPQGFSDYALGKINPDDKDYGATIDVARSNSVERSIDDLYFWSNVVTLTLLAGVTTVFLFHLRAADKKEVIAASLIAQLWNGRVSDRIEIERRTEQYNSLVDQHNVVVERELMAKSQAAPGEDQEADDLKRTVINLESRTKAGSGLAPMEMATAPAIETSDKPTPMTEAANRQQKTVLLERRIEAMRNTEQNLRERLNQTAALLEQERQRNQTLKGA